MLHNIIYINHYAGSDIHGMEYRPYYLAREWVKSGHQVTIVASSFSHIRSKNIDIKPKQQYHFEDIDGINYIWCKTHPYISNGIKRALNIFEFLYRLFHLRHKLIKQTPTIIIASSTYPFDTIFAKYLARKTNAKFIYEVHDLWPLTPIELNGMSPYHPFIWLMQRAENYGYKHADKVVSLLPNAKKYMIDHGMNENKFHYIPNGVAVNENQNNPKTNLVSLPEEHTLIINNAKKQFKLLVGYAGGMGDANALSYLLDVAKSPKMSQVGFILVGDGANKSILSNETKKHQLHNIFFLSPVTKSQIPSFLDKMNVLYIGWHNLPIYRFGVSPNKIFDYMLAKKPILHSISSPYDIVKIANCGISVPAEHITQIILAITAFINMDNTEREMLGLNGYNYVIKHHTYHTLAKSFC